MTTKHPVRGGVHRFPLRVFFEDTDAAGIVYYANYLKFAERARSEFLRQAGYSHGEMIDETGLVFVVRRCVVDYMQPARFEDELEILTAIERVGRASIHMGQVVRRGGLELVRLDVKLACVGLADGKPRGIPDVMRALLNDLVIS